MGEVRIKALKNGPLEVSGKIALVGSDGKALSADEEPIYLCRCGHSSNKPLCDGSHKKVGFQG